MLYAIVYIPGTRKCVNKPHPAMAQRNEYCYGITFSHIVQLF